MSFATSFRSLPQKLQRSLPRLASGSFFRRPNIILASSIGNAWPLFRSRPARHRALAQDFRVEFNGLATYGKGGRCADAWCDVAMRGTNSTLSDGNRPFGKSAWIPAGRNLSILANVQRFVLTDAWRGLRG